MSSPMDLKNAQLEKLRAEQYELKHTVAKLESELKIYSVKSSAVQSELERMVKENKNLINVLQKEKSEKNQLLIKDRGNVESRRFETLNKVMTQENETFKAEIQKLTAQKIALIKEKQQLSNKLVISESKLLALGSQEEVINGLTKSLELTMRQNEELKYQIEVLTKNNRDGPTVKTILKDNDQTREDLLKEFQQKIMSKELANIQMKEEYQKKIAKLNLKVAELSVKIPQN